MLAGQFVLHELLGLLILQSPLHVVVLLGLERDCVRLLICLAL